MANSAFTIVNNGYCYICFNCEDDKLFYAAGVKHIDPLAQKDVKKIERIKEMINDYAVKYEIIKLPVLRAELRAYLIRELKPDKKVKKTPQTNDLVEDHKQWIADMRAGKILKKKSKKRLSPKSIDQYERMRERWEECAASIPRKDIENAETQENKIPQDSGFLLSYDMTIDHVNNLIVWLIKNEYSQNSIYNIVNNLKIFLKWSYDKGKHSNEVFRHENFSIPQEDAEAIAPTYEEILQLYNHQFTKKSHERARDFFVYGCFLALRVEDLRRINDYHLVGYVYEVLTSKTDKKVTIPCHWIAREIYEKYNGVIPVMWRQNLYKLLPIICKAAGITGKKLITYTVGGEKVEQYFERWELFQPHTMRRFFATWMYWELKYHPKEIMPITGHESEAQFLKYVRIEHEVNARQIANSPAFRKPLESSSGLSVVV